MRFKIQNFSRVFSFLIILALFLNLGSYVFKNREVFGEKYDPDYWQERYEQSQWAKGHEATELMGDGELYAYAGWRQIQGDDPTVINAEQPPIGKYLFGTSILFFGNPKFASLFFGTGLLLVTFLVGRQILKDTTLALLPALFLSFEALFKDDLLTSSLDLFFAFFVCLTLLFLLKAEKRKINFFFSMISLSLVAVTKVYLVGFGLLAALSVLMVFMTILKKDKKYLYFFLALPFFGLTYLLSYVVYFLKGNSLWDFKYLHFWIRHFARVQVADYPNFEIFRILVFDRWMTWWDGFKRIKVHQWNVFWPVSFVSSLGGIIAAFRNRSYSLFLVLTFIFAFLVIYSFGVPYPRYLLPILPGLYIILVYITAELAGLKAQGSKFFRKRE